MRIPASPVKSEWRSNSFTRFSVGRSVGRFSFAAVCVRTPRMRNRTSLCTQARTRNRGVVRLRTRALRTRAQTRASLQINSTRACFAGRLFSIRCACFFLFRDICQQRTSLPSRCFVFKLDERGLLEDSCIWIFDSFLFFFFFFFMIFQCLMFGNETFDTLCFKTGKDRNYEKI